MKIDKMITKQIQLQKIFEKCDFSEVSQIEISDSSISIHGETSFKERKDFIEPLVEIFGAESASFLSFEKQCGSFETLTDEDGDIIEDEKGVPKSEFKSYGYSHLYITFKD